MSAHLKVDDLRELMVSGFSPPGTWTEESEVQFRRARDSATYIAPRKTAGGFCRRALVDRLWPRGLSKAAADLDEWCKEIAPSPELRSWYSHDLGRFEDVQSRYRAELDDPERANALTHLRDLLVDENLTLLTATAHPEISQASVLAAILSG
jgi:uncharacterized protein YeaO (DUF488 family)